MATATNWCQRRRCGNWSTNEHAGLHGDYRVFEGADHVFATHADAVSEAVEDFCGKSIARRQIALAAD